MFIKNFPVEENIPFTADFTQGIDVNGNIIKGRFGYFEIMFSGKGLTWVDFDRDSQIFTPGEDGCMPVGGMGYFRIRSEEFHKQNLYKKLGKLQVLPSSSGYITVIIWIHKNETRKVIRS